MPIRGRNMKTKKGSQNTQTTQMVPKLFKYKFRVILIGDSNVGKTTLVKYLLESKYSMVSNTVGVDIFEDLIQINDGTMVKLELWDTAGQEKFKSITKNFYRNIDGVVFVYDITNDKSFKNIPMWMTEVEEHIELKSPVLALVGSKVDKSDRKKDEREVSYNNARAFAQKHQMRFIEASSKTGENVREIFVAVTQAIYNKLDKDKIGDGLQLQFELVEETPKKSCSC